MPKPKKPYYAADPRRTSYKYAEQLDCTTFKEFVDTQLNAPIRLVQSEKVFWGLSEKAQKLVKAVKFFTPCAFEGTRAEKNNGNAKSISLVCVDVDDNGDARQILHNLPFLYEALAGLNFAVYTTCSHTEDNPRCRVVVDADGFDVSLYKQAVSWVAGRLGLTSVTPESKTVSQAMYRPTIFSDTDIAEEHPLQAHEVSQGPLTVEMFTGTKEVGSSPRGGSQPTVTKAPEGLEYLEPRLESVTLGDVKNALSATDPDVDMMTWVKVGMGMRHQFTDQDEEAFEVYNEWSSKGDKYEGEEKTRYRWDHFSANTNDRVPVTIRTTLLIAKKAGWDNEKIQQRYYDELVEYIEGVQSFSTLAGRAIDKIAASPLLTPTLQESLLSIVVTTAKVKFKQRLTLTTLSKSLKHKLSLLRQTEIEQSQKDKPLPVWTRNLAFISSTKKIMRISSGEMMDRDAFDSAYGRELLPSKDQIEKEGMVDTPRVRSTPIMRPQDYVLNELQIPTVYDTMYDPRNGDEMFIKDRNGVSYVNEYRKTHPTASEDLAATAMAGEAFTSHIKELIKEPEYQRTILDFLAHNVQFPGVKIRWSPLIQGGEGCGKGLIARTMRAVMGRGHVKAVDPEKIFSSYNDWAYGAALVVLNEIHSKGHSRYEVENKLKEPIADDHVSINQKFRDHREIENVTNYIMFTNFQDALAISDSSRRYFVVKSPLQRKDDILKLTGTGHFDRVFDVIDNYPRALRAWFEQYEISEDFSPEGPPPVTRYMQEMQEITKPETEQEVLNILEDGDHALIQKDLVSSTSLLNVLNSGAVKPTNGKHLSHILLSNGFIKGPRMRYKEERVQIWFGEGSEGLQKLNTTGLQQVLDDRVSLACGDLGELE